MLRKAEWDTDAGPMPPLPIPGTDPGECFLEAKGSTGFPIGKEDEILGFSPLDEDFVAVERRAASLVLDEKGWRLDGISSPEADYLDKIGGDSPFELGMFQRDTKAPAADGLSLLPSLESLRLAEQDPVKGLGPCDYILLPRDGAGQVPGGSRVLPLPESAPPGICAVGFSQGRAFVLMRRTIKAPLMRNGKAVGTLEVPALCRLAPSLEEAVPLLLSAITSLPSPSDRLSFLALGEGKGYFANEAEGEARLLLKGDGAPEILDRLIAPVFEKNGLRDQLGRLSQALFGRLLDEERFQEARSFVIGHPRQSRGLGDTALERMPVSYGRSLRYLRLRALGFPFNSATRMSPPLPIDCPPSDIPEGDELLTIARLKESAQTLAGLVGSRAQAVSLGELESCARTVSNASALLAPFKASCPAAVEAIEGECNEAMRKLTEWNEERFRSDEVPALRSLLRQGDALGAAMRTSSMLEQTLSRLLPESGQRQDLHDLIPKAKDAGIITEKEFTDLDEFRRLRNLYAHEHKKAEARNPADAEKKISACLDIIERLRRNR